VNIRVIDFVTDHIYTYLAITYYLGP